MSADVAAPRFRGAPVITHEFFQGIRAWLKSKGLYLDAKLKKTDDVRVKKKNAEE